jgi:hypothetical protein
MTIDQFAIKSRKYALKALKDQRAAIASEIEKIKRQWNLRRQQLIHVEATIQLSDSTADISGRSSMSGSSGRVSWAAHFGRLAHP